MTDRPKTTPPRPAPPSAAPPSAAPPSAALPPAPGRAFLVALIATLGIATAFSQFYRNSVGVVATTLAGELGLSPSQLGTLASSFFLVFALCQIPVGIVIDRYGPRAAMLASAAFVIAGAFVFAGAGGYGTLLAGRLLLGIGCSSFLMAPLVIYARLFPPATFASVAGLHLSISSLGNIGATVPLALATASFGWRAAFLASGLAAAVLAFAIVRLVRGPSAARQADREPETLGQALRGVAGATRFAGFWRLFLMQLCTYSTFGLVIGLWGGPYLAHVHGADLTTQGNVLLAMALAQVLGMLLWGLGDRLVGSYRPLIAAGALSSIAVLLALILAGHRVGVLGTAGLFTLLGAAAAYSPVLIAQGKALFPPEMAGRGMTLLNIGTVAGGFLTQWATGLAVRLVAGAAPVYPVAAFQTAFAMQAALITVAVLVYLRAPPATR